MEKEFKVKISKKDFELLDKYGFYFEKNIEVYLHNIANEMRKCIAENVKGDEA